MIAFVTIIISIGALFLNTWLFQVGYNMTFLKFFPEQLPVISYYQMMALYTVIGLIESINAADAKAMVDMTSDERDIMNVSRIFMTAVKNVLVLFVVWVIVGLAGL